MCAALSKERPNVQWAKTTGPLAHEHVCLSNLILGDSQETERECADSRSMSSWSSASDGSAAWLRWLLLDVWWATDPSPQDSLHSSPPVNAAFQPQTASSGWAVGWECNVERVSGNGRGLPTALHHSNGAVGRALRLAMFTTVLRPLQVAGTHF